MVGRILTNVLFQAGRLIYWSGGAPLVRWLGRNNPKVVLYHDCSEKESPYLAGLNCTTSPSTFEAHLRYLKRYYRLVDVDAILEGQAAARSVAITFDDGYSSVFHHAFPHLTRLDLPATVYLISSVVDNGALVWVNELNHALRSYGEKALKVVGRYFPWLRMLDRHPLSTKSAAISTLESSNL